MKIMKMGVEIELSAQEEAKILSERAKNLADNNRASLKRKKEKKKEELRSNYIDAQIMVKLNAVDSAATEEQLEAIG